VEIRGEKVRSTDGLIPTRSVPLAEARIRPPLVAVAVASTWFVQVVLPAGRKGSCQNVLRGSRRCPIATVAQTPRGVIVEVAIGKVQTASELLFAAEVVLLPHADRMDASVTTLATTARRRYAPVDVLTR
jgi:hypothetical protein